MLRGVHAGDQLNFQVLDAAGREPLPEPGPDWLDGLDEALDQQFIALAQPAIRDGHHVSIDLPIRNVHRTVGTLLGHEVTKQWKGAGLPDGTIDIRLTGSAGQSFGAFVPAGIQMRLVGDGNDYVGKGLSGGRLIVHPHPLVPFAAEDHVIAGNVIGYGATGGEIFLRGNVGERFCVRNSGALAVSEGIGDHGCEYMTGGVVAVLGHTGRNFAAGMSGGIAYVLDEDGSFAKRCNLAMVDLEPVPEEDDLMESEHHTGGDIEHHGRVDVSSDMTRHDDERLRQLIEHHRQYTGSERAALILENWDEYRPKFV